MLENYKIKRCDKKQNHSPRYCFNHHDSKDKRRPCTTEKSLFLSKIGLKFSSFDSYSYTSRLCQNEACNNNNCKYSHNKIESLYHPKNFRKQDCKHEGCKFRYCSFLHERSTKIIQKPKELKNNQVCVLICI